MSGDLSEGDMVSFSTLRYCTAEGCSRVYSHELAATLRFPSIATRQALQQHPQELVLPAAVEETTLFNVAFQGFTWPIFRL